MRALITGGAGFIGSHLSEFLLSKGFSVVAADSLVTGKESNIKHLMGNDNFEFINTDVSRELAVDGELDFVLHFASPASPIDYQTIPVETLLTGAYGTRNALELAEEKNAVFLLASTSEVYGDPEVSPQPESYWGHVNPIGLRSCYDEAKRFAEALTMAYHRKRNVDTRIIRIFNTYGPRMRANDGRVIPAFMTQALNNEPLTVFGTGKQTRSFCYITDLVEGIYRVMNSSLTEPVNLGNPDEYTILELAERIIKITSSSSEITFMPLPADDPKRRKPDITRARELLGWEPEVNLDEGLRETMGWFRK